MGKERNSGDRKTTAVIAALVIFVAVLVLFFSLYPLPPSVNLKPPEGLGKELANETIKLLPSGGRIYVITRATTAFEAPAIEAALKAFVRTVKDAGATVTGTNLIQVDPARVVGVPPREFLELLGKASENDVIASFLGPPELSDGQVTKLGGKRPRVAAVCSSAAVARVDLRRLFAQQLLHVAIINRPEVASAAPSADTPQGWFAHLYQVITPANLPDLPPPPATRR